MLGSAVDPVTTATLPAKRWPEAPTRSLLLLWIPRDRIDIETAEPIGLYSQCPMGAYRLRRYGN